jgi:hypothetical protein
MDECPCNGEHSGEMPMCGAKCERRAVCKHAGAPDADLCTECARERGLCPHCLLSAHKAKS